MTAEEIPSLERAEGRERLTRDRESSQAVVHAGDFKGSKWLEMLRFALAFWVFGECNTLPTETVLPIHKAYVYC